VFTCSLRRCSGALTRRPERRYTSATGERLLPLPADLGALVLALAQVPLLERFAALHAEKQALQAHIRALAVQVGQNSANCSPPPSSDLPQAPRDRKRSHPADSGAMPTGNGTARP